MPSLFKEARPSHGPFNRINILSPATPIKAGEALTPCALATAPIEVRGWSRPGLGHYILRTSACGDLYRVDVEDGGPDEMVVENAVVEDDLGRPASSSASRGTACVKWTFTELGVIAEPGTYFFRVRIMNDAFQVIGEIDSAEVVVEPAQPDDAAIESAE
ncbi:hypothetical protein CONLIGDRAFT_681000 [Coniochaeta ligniaria NRRL 30616]|uniref:Uncharacterized protein n=1 Tax=Coniochaeta ligniaria NRRL 30616 TaxID=1408157 RepID=A0A1J7ISA1_9PEZI|nr:hypothetical protein CONLIGDRAFT_681000 [Coniochaeta ligniaria NRRL 30616]